MVISRIYVSVGTSGNLGLYHLRMSLPSPTDAATMGYVDAEIASINTNIQQLWKAVSLMSDDADARII